MTSPVSIPNASGQRIDTIYGPDGTAFVKLAIGGPFAVGFEYDAAAQSVGTHPATGGVVGATDPVVLVGGVDDASLDGPTGDVPHPLLVDSLGRIILGGGTDDTAFAIGAHKVNLAGFVADETATDSVDEGDVGYARMTLDRKQLSANQSLDDSAFGVATGYVGAAGFLADETATDSVDEGDVGAARMTLDRRVIVVPEAYAKGGATPVTFISAATNNATSLKGTPGKVLYVTAININAAVRYLKFYDKATAPSPGSDTPKLIIPLPASSVPVFINLGSLGADFPTGIAYALVTGISQTDNTSTAANEQLVSIGYA